MCKCVFSNNNTTTNYYYHYYLLFRVLSTIYPNNSGNVCSFSHKGLSLGTCSVAKLCLTFCDPVDCTPPGSSFQFPRQEYQSGLPFPPPGDLPQPRDQTRVFCLADRFFTTEPPGKLPSLGKNRVLEILAITFFSSLFVVDTGCLWLWTSLPTGLPGEDLHAVQKGLQGSGKSSHGSDLLSGSRHRLHL